MKYLALAATLIIAAAAVRADPAEGIWQTSPGDNGNFGYIEVTRCGEEVCGTLIRAYNAAGEQIESPNLGRRIIWDMRPQGDNAYAKGKIYSPDRDKTYSSRMQLNGDRLAVRGCVLGVCRDGGTWRRVE